MEKAREQQLQEKAIDLVCELHEHSSGHVDVLMDLAIIAAFMTGAKFADKTHTNIQFMERACGWLGENAGDYVEYDDNLNLAKLINDFKEYMKE